MESDSGSRWWGWLCAALALVATAVTMHAHGFGAAQQLQLVSAVLLQLVLPGLALTVWMRRPTPLAWLGSAFVLGLPAQLAGWALGVTLGSTVWMWAIPIALGIIGLLATRRRLGTLVRRRSAMPAWQGAALLGAWLILLRQIAAHWTLHPSGDDAVGWYHDMYWHLAINASAMHRIPMQDPQAIAEVFNYHWLTNGHIAGVAASTGLDLTLLSPAAWLLPVSAALFGVTFGLAHHIARTPTAGTLAVVLVIAAPSFAVNQAARVSGSTSIHPLSPSHMLALPVTVMMVWLLAVMLKSGSTSRRRAVLPLVLIAILVSGVKVSTLPVLLCGVIAAGFATVLAGHRRRVVGLLLVLLFGILVSTFPLFGGGGGGSTFGLLRSQELAPIFQASSDLLDHLGPRGDTALFGGFVVLLLANSLWMAPGLFALRWRDPIGWLNLGVIASATGVTYVLAHPGRSEYYFPMGVQPIMAIAAAVGMMHVLRKVPRTYHPKLVAVAIGSLLVGAWATTYPRWDSLTLDRVAGGIALLVALLVISGVLVWRLGWWRGAAACSAVLLAFSCGSGVREVTDGHGFAHLVPSKVEELIEEREPGFGDVTADEMEALKAVTELPVDAVVATNVHCIGAKSWEFCDARAFWVSGLGQRRVILGGWGYTALGRSTEGDGGRRHNNNPYPDEELFELNEKAFSAPDGETFAKLKELGATHVFADRRAGEVQPSDEWCEPVFENDTVTLCEIN